LVCANPSISRVVIVVHHADETVVSSAA